MPNCFSLTKKGETEPKALTKIDDEICEMLGVPSDPVMYAYYWYDIIGFRLAIGHSFEKIIQDLSNDGDGKLVQIAKWLNENYVANAWAER